MGETYDKICNWENLRLTYRKAARGKRGKRAAAAFEYNLADRLLELQEQLAAKTYQPGPYHSFYIHEPKRRLISAAPFGDRVVHHALCNVVEPVFEQEQPEQRLEQQRFSRSGLPRLSLSRRKCPLAKGWGTEALRDGPTSPWPSLAPRARAGQI